MTQEDIDNSISEIYRLIDDLKAISTQNGLGNSGSEYKIITQTFLYKFLNDKFFHYMKAVPLLKSLLPGADPSNVADLEAGLVKLDDASYELLLTSLPAYVAVFKPSQFISTLYNERQKPGFHQVLDKAFLDIADQNKEVFGVTTGEGNRVSLFDGISSYIVDPQLRDGFASAIVDKLVDVSFERIFDQKFDFFADIFEYLIGDYNKDSGKYAEYYTPHSIAKIIAAILARPNDHDVSLYDPAAGSGMLILTLADRIGEETSTVYTQDITQKSNEILRLNLILNNLVASLPNAIQADTLVNPRHLNKTKDAIAQFDYVVSNPPFNIDFSETRDILAGEKYKKRFFAGVPNVPKKDKKSMAIYLMFIQHIIRSMKPGKGRAAIVVPSGFLTASTGIAPRIRQYIMGDAKRPCILRAVVSMPSNIFANTTTNVSVVFLDNQGPQDGKILLVDASNLGEKKKVDGTKNQRTYLRDFEMQRIIDTVNSMKEQEDFSVLTDIENIREKNCSFSPGQYFKVKIDYVTIAPEDFQRKMNEYKIELIEYFSEGSHIGKEILETLNDLNYEKK